MRMHYNDVWPLFILSYEYITCIHGIIHADKHDAGFELPDTRTWEQSMTEHDDCALDSNAINIIHNAIPISDERHIARWYADGIIRTLNGNDYAFIHNSDILPVLNMMIGYDDAHDGHSDEFIRETVAYNLR